ncbi:hypothetical protein DNTS_002687 [Danionella cerebrum]|uniref:Uncharacterized protein n=1 Tax=Danionella cerebrum TaxID=2873325 RepID=A0A553NKS9_9TELE|nr:hypothetical protein DNTS_002687 [Danionella translucida]
MSSCCLPLTIGSQEERGIKTWRKAAHEGSQMHVSDHSCYNLPFSTNFLKRFRLFQRLPFLPSVNPVELGTRM